MYFRGMRHVIDKWDEEAEDVRRCDLWETCVEEVLDMGGDEIDLLIMEERYNKLKDTEWCDPDIIIDEFYILGTPETFHFSWEVYSWIILMFVSKYSFIPCDIITVPVFL
jgi:hypothetical protein